MTGRRSTGLLAVVLSLVTASCLYAAEGWLTDFDSAKKLAAEKGFPVLADFSGSDWCGWCIKLDREVFSQTAFLDYAKKNLVLFLADFPSRAKQSDEVKRQNEELSERYGVRGFPTVLLLDANGRVLARTGYREGGAEAYVDHLRQLADQHQAGVKATEGT